MVAENGKPTTDRRKRLILAINPGSTSTKLALFRLPAAPGRGEPRRLDERAIVHTPRELRRFRSLAAQESWRAHLVGEYLAGRGVGLQELAAVVGRGGLLRPLAGGTWRVGPRMLAELRRARWGVHASNLGAPLAARVARRAGAPAFIVDPVVTDELAPEARLTGLPQIRRRSVFHALSQKAAARLACEKLGLAYGKARLAVAHLGGGISVGAHLRGRIVEVNNALDGEGPFSPERAGALPAAPLVRLALSGTLGRGALERRLVGSGGLVAHLGTNSLLEVERRMGRGDRRARLVFEALAYGVARAVTGAFAALSAAPDAIVLTGGMAGSRRLVGAVRRRVGFAAPLLVFPGNLEMAALAAGAWRVLSGRERARQYR